ncbi:MAG: putative bifunctional diguanylate cyclase/phosphodiesterase [Sphingomonadaceae bacterium]
MATHALLRKIRTIIPHTDADALNERVRRSLVRTLYTQPASLAIGAINGIAASGIATYVSGSQTLAIGSLILTVIAMVRVGAAYFLSVDDDGPSTNLLELTYEIGAFSYALALGSMAALCLLVTAPAAVEVLIIANATCYGVGICARNAGRPTIALGQLFLTCAPIMVVALHIGTLPFIALAATMVLLFPAMASIVMNLFRELRNSIREAERNAELAETMRVLARTDVVTGLANRAGLNHELVEQLMALPQGKNAALFWIDLDRFKEVNDLLGHAVGDRLLVEIGRRLSEIMPEDAIVSRFGGDEFILFCEVATRHDAERLASEVHAEIMRPVRIDGDRMEVRASLGVAVLPDDGDDADKLMQSADLALYQAKSNGRGQTCFFHQSMTRDLVRRREIEAELRAAIQKDELSIFFQPIVDLATGKIRSFEALVRWFHPEKGEMRPDEFIPVAEETGVIVTLGNWITAQAAKAAAQWPDDVTVAVNLSPLQIHAPGSVLGIRNALREAGLPPHRLVLEITESVLLDESDATTFFIETLAADGIKFALDDFGTGYSSLGYINRFPFSKIKVDRSFVSGPNVGRKTEAIIHAVAEMGSRLEMEIVAEGLETIDQVKAVRDAGCTLGQGYYFSRAVPDYLAAMLLAQEGDESNPHRLIA